tara:strand:- start:1640 stop:2452 length:813 start_codon:yes stop_codon:yes gene_type:complete
MQLRLIIKFKKLYSSNNRMTTLIQTFGGNIGIGTNDPGSYRLRVDGGVRVSSLEIGGVGNAIAPTGLIGLWHGILATIPAGWVICDGTNDTPDLRDKFIRCANGDDVPATTTVGTVGGSDNTTLTEPMLDSHSHPVTVTQGNTQDNHSHGTSTSNTPHYHNTSGNNNHSHSVQGMNWRQASGWINNNVGGSGNQWAFHAGYHLFAPGSVTTRNSHNHNVPGAHANHGHQQGAHPNSPAPHAHQAQAGSVGNGAAIPVTNPYYALYYIMKT